MTVPQYASRTGLVWSAAGAAALGYMVLLGGTVLGETDPILRLISALVGAVLIVMYLAWAARESDRIDNAVLLALLLFLVACVLSAFPRQSFDAALAALGYVAAFFVGRRLLSAELSQRLFAYTGVAMSIALTLVATQRWLLPLLEWWANTGWSEVPPLGMELSGFPWGHRHDLALLVAMLYPAWWLVSPSPLRRAGALVFGILGLLIVLADGSRSLWLAMAVASGIAAVPALRARMRSRRLEWAAAIGTVVLIALALASGIADAFVSRLSNLATLDWRAALWGSLMESWLEHPIAGSGPGSFVWILQPTGYFDTNSWAPRHPDNAVIHMLAEGGVVGLLALAVLAMAIMPPVLRSTSTAARWALAVFGVAALGANPTNFAFLVALAIGWAAFALPLPLSAGLRIPRLAFAIPMASVLVAITVGYASMTFAAFAYHDARRAIADSRLADAGADLDSSVAFDPGMALYRRQRGILQHLAGDHDAAIGDLSRAVAVNPSDDVAWRAMALATDAAGDIERRDRALATAIELQRSDPANLLMRVALGSPNEEAGLLAQVEAVHAWPTVVFSAGWEALAARALDTEQSVAEALARWAAEEPIPDRESNQGIWLATLASRPGMLPEAFRRSGWDPTLGAALAAAIRCESNPIDVERTVPSSIYSWLFRYRESVMAGAPDPTARRMAAIMGVELPDPATEASVGVSPLNESDPNSADRWGYRRPAISWPVTGLGLPSPSAGFEAWLVRPAEAAVTAGIVDRLPDCAGSPIGNS